MNTRQMTRWVAMQAPGSASLLPYGALGQGWHACPQTFTPGAPGRHLEALLWSSLGDLICQQCLLSVLRRCRAGSSSTGPLSSGPGDPIERPLHLHDLNIWNVIIFKNIPIKLSLIILVTIQIASIKAEIGHGFIATMNLRVTLVLRWKSLHLPSRPAMNPTAKCPPFQWGLQAGGREKGHSLSCPCKAPTPTARPRPVWERGGLQATGRLGVGWGTLTHSRVHTPPCSPGVCLLRQPGPGAAPLCSSLPGSLEPSALVWLPNPHSQPDTQAPLYKRAVFTCQERQPLWRDPGPETQPTSHVTGGEMRNQGAGWSRVTQQ